MGIAPWAERNHAGRSVRLLGVTAVTASLLACGGGILTPNASGPTEIHLLCPSLGSVAVSPSALWLNTESQESETIRVHVTRSIGAPECRHTVQGFGEPGQPWLQASRWESDSVLVLDVRGAPRFRYVEVAVIVNRRLAGTTAVLGTPLRTMGVGIAHRGGGGLFPENTLVALEAAGAAGVFGSEVDIRLTRDLVPVLMHDETVDRTTNGTGAVEGMTSAEISKLDAGYRHAEKFRGQPVPTLEEALVATSGTGLRLYLDVKGQTLVTRPEYATIIAAAVKSADAEDRVTILAEPWLREEFQAAVRASSTRIRVGIRVTAPRPQHQDYMLRRQPAAILFSPIDSVLTQIGQTIVRTLHVPDSELIATTTNDLGLAQFMVDGGLVTHFLTDLPPEIFRYLADMEDGRS